MQEHLEEIISVRSQKDLLAINAVIVLPLTGQVVETGIIFELILDFIK